ncbi:tRNA-splicing endonuclease subunit SEN54 [Actinacidiphila cocklensis]|uniref:tRNA-splicing endonuclease subunit SEN54 n=1 Tax=Actinacidiphila cocklensis TaxID=887465 RepID=A0A9W4GV26_9ACTN|nr:tRNA-splicing endonuclease subunit SEN54 [Actinacidiphila cocklensis]
MASRPRPAQRGGIRARARWRGGRLADTMGHRRLVVLGVVVFAGASLLCGLTPKGSLAQFAGRASGRRGGRPERGNGPGRGGGAGAAGEVTP